MFWFFMHASKYILRQTTIIKPQLETCKTRKCPNLFMFLQGELTDLGSGGVIIYKS